MSLSGHGMSIGCAGIRELTLHLDAPIGRQVEFLFASWYVRMHKEKTVTTPKIAVVMARTGCRSQV